MTETSHQRFAQHWVMHHVETEKSPTPLMQFAMGQAGQRPQHIGLDMSIPKKPRVSNLARDKSCHFPVPQDKTGCKRSALPSRALVTVWKKARDNPHTFPHIHHAFPSTAQHLLSRSPATAASLRLGPAAVAETSIPTERFQDIERAPERGLGSTSTCCAKQQQVLQGQGYLHFMVLTATFCGVPSGWLRRPSITDPNSPVPWERSKHFTHASTDCLSRHSCLLKDLKCSKTETLSPKGRGRCLRPRGRTKT